MATTWERLKTPLIALALGILPFWLFAGASNRTVINGKVVSESNFNLLGLVMAGIGTAMAFGVLRGDGPSRDRWWARTALASVAFLLCIVQLGHSAELFDLKLLWSGAIGTVR